MNEFSDYIRKTFFDKVEIQQVTFGGKTLSVLRDDLIHPVISGNKLRKLWLYLQDAIENQKGIETFGGPYSNHITATAYAAHTFGVASRAYVRRGYADTPTLMACRRWGMQIISIEAQSYSELKNGADREHKDWLTIPEGGKGLLGVEGVRLSYGSSLQRFDEIWLAAGTLTTALGVALAALNAKVIAVPVLKASGVQLLRDFMAHNPIKVPENLDFADGYHFGGYAKWTAELLEFANQFYVETGIMTDLVYTAKSLYAFMQQNNSPSGVRKLWIHTGGLQGMMGILPQIKKKNLHLSYEAPLVAHLTVTHLADNGPKP